MINQIKPREIALTTFTYWLPLAALATVLSLVTYTLVQQDIRLNADDPQIQMAEDAAAAIMSGQPPQAVVPPSEVDIASSLAPYIIVFDDAGQPIASSARLDGQIPSPPNGVFAYAKEHSQDRFSWQPKSGLRSAVVVTFYSGQASGFVLAGRSLREVEKREDQLQNLALAGWIGSLAVSLVAVAVIVWVRGSAGR